MKKYFFMEFKDVKSITSGNTKQLICNREGCCGLKATVGPFLERKEMEENKYIKIIEKSI